MIHPLVHTLLNSCHRRCYISGLGAGAHYRYTVGSLQRDITAYSVEYAWALNLYRTGLDLEPRAVGLVIEPTG
jgi:hypothetical protein